MVALRGDVITFHLDCPFCVDEYVSNRSTFVDIGAPVHHYVLDLGDVEYNATHAVHLYESRLQDLLALH